MTAGFAGDDARSFRAMVGRPDWAAAALASPLAADPGRAFAYDTGASQVLSAILTKVTGEPAAAFAAARLFGPLGIAPPRGRPTHDDPSQPRRTPGMHPLRLPLVGDHRRPPPRLLRRRLRRAVRLRRARPRPGRGHDGGLADPVRGHGSSRSFVEGAIVPAAEGA
jgi:CubicO group peptidase (beta-lactamase class C family)